MDSAQFFLLISHRRSSVYSPVKSSTCPMSAVGTRTRPRPVRRISCLLAANPSNPPQDLQAETPAGVMPAGAVQWFREWFTSWVGVGLSDAPLVAGGRGPADRPARLFRGV